MASKTIDSHPGLYSFSSNGINNQIIGEDAMVFVHISVNITLNMTIAAIGLVTNFINTLIFSKLGLRDSMSVGLFSLSITDFFVASIQASCCIFFIIDITYPNLTAKTWFMCYFCFAWAGNSAISISNLITAVVAVERCLCVAAPFRVKQICTKGRCVIAVLSVYTSHIVLGLPYIIVKLYEIDYHAMSHESNTSCEVLLAECVVTFSPGTASFLAAIDLAYGVSVSVLLQSVVLLSAVWMGYSLQVTSRVRSKRSELTSQKRMSSPAKKHSTSNRERRLVKVVFCLAVTSSICNAPQLIAAMVYHLVPKLGSEEEHHLSTTMWSAVRTIGTLGCSSSFLVYLKLNRNYRQMFWKLFAFSSYT